jgi:hypothetical protein
MEEFILIFQIIRFIDPLHHHKQHETGSLERRLSQTDFSSPLSISHTYAL